jgi:hypothetical protein
VLEDPDLGRGGLEGGTLEGERGGREGTAGGGGGGGGGFVREAEIARVRGELEVSECDRRAMAQQVEKLQVLCALNPKP